MGSEIKSGVAAEIEIGSGLRAGEDGGVGSGLRARVGAWTEQGQGRGRE